MVIREALDSDIVQIVSLLKESLGEALMPKSETFWKWKHKANPFGISPVLLAEENGVITGVRAFMKWKWRYGESIFQSVRAIDTATHPDHQGKGIFSKLTLAQVKNCQDEGVHFIFNTPNEKSMPGYLKMGWKQAGKLPVGVNLKFSAKSKREHNYHTELLNDKRLDDLLLSWNERNKNNLITDYSSDYLKWRYQSNPVATYFTVGAYNGDSSFLVILRMKPHRMLNEVRICDLFYGPQTKMKSIKEALNEFAFDSGFKIQTIASNDLTKEFSLTNRQGPMITVRDLNLGDENEKLVKLGTWAPSLGDMELF